MANRLGTVRKVVSRKLGRFQSDGLIRLHRRESQILNRKGLEAEAETNYSVTVPAEGCLTGVKKSIAVAAMISGLAFGQEAPAAKESKKRPAEKRPAIMGTAAAAGAAIGAAVAKDNRAKGAIMGAAVGGLAGLIFDQIMKKKDQGNEQAETR